MATMTFTRQSLEKATERVANDPSRGQTTYTNRAIVSDGTRCHVRDGDNLMTFNVPKGMGGDGDATTPGTALRAGFASCIAIGIKLWAARKNVRIDHVEVFLEADSDARGQFGIDSQITPGYSEMRIGIEVSSSEAEELIRDVIDASLEHSVLLDVIANPQKINLTTTIHDNSMNILFLERKCA